MSKHFKAGAALGALAGLYFLAFLILYIPNYVIENSSIAVTYIVTFVNKLFEFVLPLITATILFVSCTKPKLELLVRVSIISVSTFAYNIPYYYLVYLAQGNDSIEALGISLLVSLAAYVFSALLATLFYLIMLFGTVRGARRDSIKALPPAYREHTTKEQKKQLDRDNIAALPMHIAESRTIDLTSPVTFGIFCACFVQFSIHLAVELVSIISYLIEYLGDYRDDEIIYIVVALLFIFASMFISHFACYLVKYIMTKGESFDDKNEAVGE